MLSETPIHLVALACIDRIDPIDHRVHWSGVLENLLASRDYLELWALQLLAVDTYIGGWWWYCPFFIVFIVWDLNDVLRSGCLLSTLLMARYWWLQQCARRCQREAAGLRESRLLRHRRMDCIGRSAGCLAAPYIHLLGSLWIPSLDVRSRLLLSSLRTCGAWRHLGGAMIVVWKLNLTRDRKKTFNMQVLYSKRYGRCRYWTQIWNVLGEANVQRTPTDKAVTELVP